MSKAVMYYLCPWHGFEKEGGKHRRKAMNRKKKNTTEENEKCYPLWDNGITAYAWFGRIKGKRYLAATGADICLSVIQPFAAMALPSAVVYLLGSGWRPEVIFLSLAGYVLLLQALQISQVYLANVVQIARFLFRGQLGPELFEACLTVDFQELESAKGQQKLGKYLLRQRYGN